MLPMMMMAVMLPDFIMPRDDSAGFAFISSKGELGRGDQVKERERENRPSLNGSTIHPSDLASFRRELERQRETFYYLTEIGRK